MDPEDDVAGTIRDETAAEMVEQPARNCSLKVLKLLNYTGSHSQRWECPKGKQGGGSYNVN